MSDVAEVLAVALGSHYRIERELGGGGMSRVFVAEELALGRRVAIKVLPPELAEGITAERFRREIQLAAQLQHPHIVPLLTSDRAGRTGLLPDAVRRGRDAAGAAGPRRHAAGRRRGAHRARCRRGPRVRPRPRRGAPGHQAGEHPVVERPRAGARLRRGKGAPSREHGGGTTAGIALGTPLYMAPEQAAGGGKVDGRADSTPSASYSTSCSPGRPPFEGDSAYDLLAAHIADKPEPLRRRSAETPAALETVVMRCLAKRAGERYQTAGELVAELDGLGTPPVGSARAARARTARGCLWPAPR